MRLVLTLRCLSRNTTSQPACVTALFLPINNTLSFFSWLIPRSTWHSSISTLSFAPFLGYPISSYLSSCHSSLTPLHHSLYFSSLLAINSLHTMTGEHGCLHGNQVIYGEGHCFYNECGYGCMFPCVKLCGSVGRNPKGGTVVATAIWKSQEDTHCMPTETWLVIQIRHSITHVS